MGGGTVLISLPKAWAKKNRVVKGGTLVVDELSPRKLVVHPLDSGPELQKEAVVDYPGESLSYVINDVTGAYLLGYDVIKIQGRQVISREDRQKINSMIGRLIGLEIMDEDSKAVTLQFLPESSILDPEKIVRRMASLTRGMLRDVREGTEQGDPKILSLVTERDDEVDRLYFLLVRAIRTATIDPELAERFGLAPVECLDYRVLASFLESLGDSIAELARRLTGETTTKEFARNFEAMLKGLEEMEELAIRSFLGRRTNRSRGAYLELEAMEHDVAELSSRTAQLPGISTGAAVDVLSLVERIANIFKDISDLSLPTYAFQRSREMM